MPILRRASFGDLYIRIIPEYCIQGYIWISWKAIYCNQSLEESDKVMAVKVGKV
jgi:hypothetical protein